MFKYGSKSPAAYKSLLESTTHDYALIRLQSEVRVENNNYPVLVPDFREEGKNVTVSGYMEVAKE